MARLAAAPRPAPARAPEVLIVPPAAGAGAPNDASELTVVIVSHNTRDLLRECLRSLAAAGDRVPLRVIVVDNASRDDSPAMVRREFPGVELAANPDNVGYSRAVNQALRVARGPYALVLNPDILVRPGSLDRLVSFMEEHPRAGVAGGKLLNPDGSLQHSCRTFYTLRTLLYRRTVLGKIFPRSRVIRDHLMADWDHAAAREVDWVLGACMMVRREAIHDVGLMDERFFLYFEDVDWCYRMNRRGWKVWYVPDAVMVHHHRRESAQGGITDKRFLNHLNSVFHFYDKWNRALFSLKRYRKGLGVLLLLASDFLAVNAAFFAAWCLRWLMGAWLEKPLFPVSTYALFLLFVNVTTVMSLAAFGLYAPRGGARPGEELGRLGRAMAASFLILMAGTVLARSHLVSRIMIWLFWPLATLFALGGRLALDRLHRDLRRGQFDLRRALLVGEGEAAGRLAREIELRPEYGYEIVRAVTPAEGRWQAGELARIVREEQIEEVLLAVRGQSPERLGTLVMACRSEGVAVTVFHEAAELVALGARLQGVGLHEGLAFDAVPWSGPAWRLKRALDVAGALAGLALVPPAGLVFWLAGRGRRPLVAAREAVGRDGRRFGLRAFAGGEGGASGPARGESPWRSLPALWSVLRGEMSLVGPRPRLASEGPREGEWGAFVARFPPGWTGLWRVQRAQAAAAGEPGDVESRCDELDRRYVRNWSVALDLRILAETLLGLDRT